MTTDPVKLRPLEFSDNEGLARLANNKNIWINLRDYFPHPYGQEDAKEFIKQTKSERPQQNFGIEAGGNLCGVIGIIIQPDVYRKSGELGFWLGEAYWGRGIATKAVELITDYGFRELELVRIYAGVFAYNSVSMHVLEKNGYQKEGVFRNAILKDDQIGDEHRYFKLKKRFDQGT